MTKKTYKPKRNSARKKSTISFGLRMKNFIINGLYITGIFVATLAIASISLANKINVYLERAGNAEFSIVKEEIVVSSQIRGTITEVLVKPGQQVSAGQLLITLEDNLVDAKIETLENYSDNNLSAKTEVEILKSQSAAYQITSPRDGVISSVPAIQGASYSGALPLINMYANDGVTLEASVNDTQLQYFQEFVVSPVFNYRMEQSFNVQLLGVDEVELSEDGDNTYHAIFAFEDLDDGLLFHEGEKLFAYSSSNGLDTNKPAFLIANAWNAIGINKIQFN